MNGSVIIVAPAGTGKSMLAPSLLQSLGCARLVDEWDGVQLLEAGDLALTNALPRCVPAGATVLSLEEAQGYHKTQVEGAFAKVFKRYGKALEDLSKI